MTDEERPVGISLVFLKVFSVLNDMTQTYPESVLEDSDRLVVSRREETLAKMSELLHRSRPVVSGKG